MKKNLSVFTVVVLVVFAFSSLAQVQDNGVADTCCFELGLVSESEWEKLNGPYGCYLADLAVDPTNPQIIYAATDGGGGAYKSYDGGQTWQEINTGLTDFYGWDIETDPGDPQTLYLGTWEKFFKTTDGGTTWYEITYDALDFAVLAIAIDPTNPQILYAGGLTAVEGTGMYKTTDGGENWSVKNVGIINSFIWSITVDPNNSSTVYAGTWLLKDNFIYKSIDGGETWKVCYTTTVAISCLVVDPTDSLTIYAATDAGVLKSTDGGKTWHESSYGITNLYVRHLTIDPANVTVLYTATWGGVFKSINAGSTWTSISDDFYTLFAKTVIIDPSNSQTVYAGVWGGVYKSTDAGGSWYFNDEGLHQDVAIGGRSITINPANNKMIYVGTYGGGVYKTTNGGCSWQPYNNGLIIGYGQACVINPFLPDILFFATDGAGIYRTTDGGDTWESCNTGITSLFIYTFAFDPTDPGIVYVGTSDGPSKSTDGGDSWSAINEGLEDQRIQDLDIDATNPDIIYAAANWLFKSIDGGVSWFKSDSGISYPFIQSVEIDPTDPQILYAGTMTGVVYKTTDGGGTWFESNEGVECSKIRDLAIDPSNTQIVYASTNNGMFRSIDGGSTWVPWNNGLTFLDVKDLAIDPQDPSIVYAGTGAGIFKRVVAPEFSSVLIPNTEECVNPGEYVTLPILLKNNTTPFGGFELEVEFDYTSMTFVSAEPGELLECFEYFTYRLLPCPACGCCKYKILLYGQYDLPNGPENIGCPIPMTPPCTYQVLLNLNFVVNNDENLRGLKIPVCFEWEGEVVNDSLVEDWECGENTFSSWSGDTLFASNLLCQFNPEICDDPGDRIQPILIFQQGVCGQNCGGIDICPAGPGECKRGDINMNDMTHEVADAVLFASYFVEGTVVFRYDEPYQICATDVNADGRTLTLSDLVYLIRVILHDAVELPKLTPSSYAVNITVSGNSVRTECAAPIGAILFEFDSAVSPTLLADMEMLHKDNKVLVWSSKGKSFSTGEVLSYTGEAELVSVTAVDRDSRELTTAITGKVAPSTFALHPAYPNPFNPFTTLSFNLPENVDYSLKIYNVAGQLVRSYEGMGSVGLNRITWDSKDNTGVEVASGVYFYKLTAGGFSATEKMVILK